METMKAGRELDALVAEKVMGWKRIDSISWSEPAPSGLGYQRMEHEVPNYSTDISAAWEVMEKVPQIMNYRRIEKNYRGGWSIVNEDCNGQSNGPYVSGETLPHAICLAALKLPVVL